MTSTAGSLKRGVQILKLLATAGSRGLPLTDIAGALDLPHPSAHRILKQLGAERLVDRHPELKRYRLGPMAFELGLAGSAIYDIQDLCAPAMTSLARETEDTVYLVVRSGFDAVCMHRVEGAFPIRTLVLEVGSRRPLGIGAGGLAILSALDDEAREDVIERVSPALERHGRLTAARLQQAAQAARERGAAVVEGTVNLGVTAVGHPFRDGMGQVVGALSVAALSQRMPARRIRALTGLLRGACQDVELRLRARKRGGWLAG